MVACAPAAEMDFQSVEMVDMCLSAALLDRFRFSSPSCSLGMERSLAGWDDGDLSEGLGAGSVPPSWHKCYSVCSAIEGNARPEVDA